MPKHRSHAAKGLTVVHDDGHHAFKRKSKPEVIPLHPAPPSQQEEIPPFLAWPSFLFEKMMNPWRTMNPWRNITSPVSWADSWQVGNRLTVPKSASSETETSYHYMVELPGITRDQIALSFQNGAIMLRVEASQEERKKGHYHHYSRSIRRAFTLPVYTDAEGITAELKDGALTIAIPKTDRPVSSKSRTINIV